MRHQPAAAGPGTKSMKLYRIVSDLIVMPHGSPQPMELDAPGRGFGIPSCRSLLRLVRSASARTGLGWSRIPGRFLPALSQVPFFLRLLCHCDHTLSQHKAAQPQILALPCCSCPAAFVLVKLVIPSNSSLALAGWFCSGVLITRSGPRPLVERRRSSKCSVLFSPPFPSPGPPFDVLVVLPVASRQIVISIRLSTRLSTL